ncbi:MAG: hypothetical protein ACTHOU_16460 [Aureliella sp.]
MEPINRQHNRAVRTIIYMLGRQFGGGPIDIYKYRGSTVSLETGEKEVSKTLTQIKRAIILPAKVERTFVKSISQISADKAFVYGGTYDRTRRMFLVNRRDAPNLSLTVNDWLVYRGSKYEIQTFDEFEFDSLWVIIANQVLGDRPSQFVLASADDILDISESQTEE